MSTIHLAYLVHRLITGGAELQMIALSERLTQDGFSVDFVVRAGAGPHDGRAREAGASIRIIGESSSSETPMATRYARRIGKHARWITTARRERYDIVDAWLNPADAFAALSRPLTRIPVVMSARLDLLPRMQIGPVTHLLEAAVNRLTDIVVANADITAAAATRDHGVPAHKVRVIRGGVELPRPFTEAERQRRRAALGATDDHFLIGCVGNFRPMKRQDLLIDAFAQLVTEHPQLRLVLVGDGDLRPQIEQQIMRRGLEGRVMLTGSATDLPPLYDAFDLFVQASNSEALPNVLLEASAAALPIVATAAGGSDELVRDGETGLIVPVDDTDYLVSAMRRAISDADLRRRMGAAARTAIERDYGMDRFAREYADLYRAQLAAKGAHV